MQPRVNKQKRKPEDLEEPRANNEKQEHWVGGGKDEKASWKERKQAREAGRNPKAESPETKEQEIYWKPSCFSFVSNAILFQAENSILTSERRKGSQHS